MPNSALEDTQVLRGGTVSSSGSAQSSVWRLKAGTKSISVDVQVRKYRNDLYGNSHFEKAVVWQCMKRTRAYRIWQLMQNEWKMLLLIGVEV